MRGFGLPQFQAAATLNNSAYSCEGVALQRLAENTLETEEKKE